jgi:hypothetical protein
MAIEALSSAERNALVGESAIPKLTVDVSDSNIPQTVEQLAGWLEQTGACMSRSLCVIRAWIKIYRVGYSIFQCPSLQTAGTLLAAAGV